LEMARGNPVFRLATQHGAFPLRPAFWVRPASPFDDDDPKPFDCIGRNLAYAYIRTYRRRLQAGFCVLCLLALSSASVALFLAAIVTPSMPALPRFSQTRCQASSRLFGS